MPRSPARTPPSRTHASQPACSPLEDLEGRLGGAQPCAAGLTRAPLQPPLTEAQPCLLHRRPLVGEGGKDGRQDTSLGMSEVLQDTGPSPGDPGTQGRNAQIGRARAPFPALHPLATAALLCGLTPQDLQVSVQESPLPRSSKQLSLKSEGRVSITKNCKRGGKAGSPWALGSRVLGFLEAPALHARH